VRICSVSSESPKGDFLQDLFMLSDKIFDDLSDEELVHEVSPAEIVAFIC
jgi:hypothetical protein